MDVAGQVLDFDLSSVSSHGVIDLPPSQNSRPPDCNQTPASSFHFYIDLNADIMGQHTSNTLKLHALLQLVSNQLPYLHDVGVTNWGHNKNFFSTDELPAAPDILNKVLTQMDDNQVGMTLFETEVVVDCFGESSQLPKRNR